MDVTNWKPASDYTVSELESMGAGWAIDPDDPTAILSARIWLFVVNGWAAVYWDGYGCDSESMPPNMLYVSWHRMIFAREWTDPSFEAVRDFLAGWNPDEMEASWDADSDKFESETGWVVVS